MDRDEIIEFQIFYSRPHGVAVERPYCHVLPYSVNDMIWRFCVTNGVQSLVEQMLLRAAQEQFDFEVYRHREAARNILDGLIEFIEDDCRRWLKSLLEPTLPWHNSQ